MKRRGNKGPSRSTATYHLFDMGNGSFLLSPVGNGTPINRGTVKRAATSTSTKGGWTAAQRRKHSATIAARRAAKVAAAAPAIVNNAPAAEPATGPELVH